MQRPEELTRQFLLQLDKHIADIVSGRKEVFYDIHDFAGILFVHPVHLSNTVKQTTGKPPCDHCEGKLAVEAKKLLQTTDWTIAEVARRLTYDPPSFTKFFKKYVGQTPSQYRLAVAKKDASLA